MIKKNIKADTAYILNYLSISFEIKEDETLVINTVTYNLREGYTDYIESLYDFIILCFLNKTPKWVDRLGNRLENRLS